MALNIKNEETQKLAQELAKLTGESMTTALTEAVRVRLDRVRSERRAGLADRLLEIGKDCAAHVESIDVQEVRVAKESGFGSANVWSGISSRTQLTRLLANIRQGVEKLTGRYDLSVGPFHRKIPQVAGHGVVSSCGLGAL